jgi:hypothetical protein
MSDENNKSKKDGDQENSTGASVSTSKEETTTTTSLDDSVSEAASTTQIMRAIGDHCAKEGTSKTCDAEAQIASVVATTTHRQRSNPCYPSKTDKKIPYGMQVTTTVSNNNNNNNSKSNNPYANKLRPSYNTRQGTGVIPASNSAPNNTDDDDDPNTSSNSSSNQIGSDTTPPPPELRLVGRTATEETPGATAVYPNNPLRQHAAIDQDFSSLSLTRSSIETTSEEARQRQHQQKPSIVRAETQPIIQARDHSRSDANSSNHKQTIIVAARVVKEHEIVGRLRTIRPLFRDWKVLTAIIILTLIIVGLAVGLTISSEKDEQAQNNPNATMFLPPETITENEKIMNSLLQTLPPTLSQLVSIPGSPQRAALNWLVDSNVLRGMEPSTILQRFLLSDLYFSTGGFSTWVNRTGWLSTDDECTWFQSSDDYKMDGYSEQLQRQLETCNSEGKLQTLILSENGLTGTIPPGLILLTDLGKRITIRKRK